MHLEKSEVLGVVVSKDKPPNNIRFIFQIDDKVDVRVGDYVEVPAGKSIIVGRVTMIKSFSDYFTNPQFIKNQLQLNLPLHARFPVDMGRWRAAIVRIVGVIEEGEIHPPYIPPEPGERVYRANVNVLKKILGLRDDGLFIGTIYGKGDLRVNLDPIILTRLHLAVLGSTGSGKSYTVGVLIEELLEHNYPVVVIDPHGEYKTFGTPNDNENDLELLRQLGLRPRSYTVGVFKPKIDNEKGITLSFRKLDVEAIAEMAKLTPVMRDLLMLAYRELKKEKLELSIENLKTKIEEISNKWGFQKRTVISLERNLAILEELGLFESGTSIVYLIQPGALTVIDLSMDMDEEIRRIFVGAFLNELFLARKEGKIPPLLVVVEESHRFAPQDVDTYSKIIMRKIAREGRKFGIGLAVVSQRIIGLDKDIISQCGTKILLRIDSKTDLDYIKQYIEGAAEERRLIPFLPQGKAMITGLATKYPIIVNIRPRKTKHGGETIA